MLFFSFSEGSLGCAILGLTFLDHVRYHDWDND